MNFIQYVNDRIIFTGLRFHRDAGRYGYWKIFEIGNQGRITISRSSRITEASRLKPVTISDAKTVTLAVGDTGVGVPDENGFVEMGIGLKPFPGPVERCQNRTSEVSAGQSRATRP